MKSWNWISGTGFKPFSAMPIAVPTMPSSESGVSKQRESPNSAVSPSVARKTPPFLPTSSPKTSTLGSRRIAVFSASFTACSRVRVGIVRSLVGSARGASQRELAVAGGGVALAAREIESGLALLAQVLRNARVDVGEDRLERRPRSGLGDAHGLVQLRRHFRHELLLERGIPDPLLLEEAAETSDRITLCPRLELGLWDVTRRIVGGRVSSHAVRARLDQ